MRRILPTCERAMAHPPSPRTIYPATLALAVASAAVLLGACANARAPADNAGAPPETATVADTRQADRVQTVDLDWHDDARDRLVPARLYWPASAARSAPVPLIVFSHGIGGSRAGYSHLGRHWAEQGYASLHVQHVGSDQQLWRGNVFTLPGRLQQATQESEAIARVADMRYALDRLLAGERGAAIDSSRIVAAGHSYGAMTAMLAAGARVERGGRALALRDPRIRAAILMSAPPFYGEADFGPILREVGIPTLHLTTTEDVIRVPGFHSPPADRVRVFDATGSSLKVLAVFEGGSHSVFMDRRGSGETPQQIRAATRELSVAFLRRVFDGSESDASGLAGWGTAHPGTLAAYRVQ
jgi:predicted dienelactone hydrolase